MSWYSPVFWQFGYCFVGVSYSPCDFCDRLISSEVSRCLLAITHSACSVKSLVYSLGLPPNFLARSLAEGTRMMGLWQMVQFIGTLLSCLVVCATGCYIGDVILERDLIGIVVPQDADAGRFVLGGGIDPDDGPKAGLERVPRTRVANARTEGKGGQGLCFVHITIFPQK